MASTLGASGDTRSGQADAVDDAAGFEPAVDDEDPADEDEPPEESDEEDEDDDESDVPEDSEDDPEEDVEPLGTAEPDRESVR